MAQMGFDQITATIAAAGSLSAAVNIGVGRIRGIIIPAGWAAATLSFQISLDGSAFTELIDDRPVIAYNAAVGYAVAASQYLTIDPVLFDGIAVIKLRSGPAGLPVAQAGGAALIIALRIP
jgi:hypothetical protein